VSVAVDPSAPEAVLDVRGLSVAYGRVRVLDNVHLRVDAGETVALLGTNGAGKSTLLRAVSGIVPPIRGRVFLGGEDVTGRRAHEIVRRGIVQMPGGRATFPGLTVEQNLRIGATGIPRSDRASRTREVIELFPWLEARRDQLAGSLSGGQQQMLALARALVARPRLLMIDELSLGLAPVVVAQLLEVVAGLQRRGVSLLVVEQHVDLALSFASRAYFLERGRVRFEGPAADLRGNRELLRAVLLTGESGRRGTTPKRADRAL
jgi:ABC-type branched-subunit amino acid transport system ATPase component